MSIATENSICLIDMEVVNHHRNSSTAYQAAIDVRGLYSQFYH
jgi:hypothetical protein